MSRSHASTLPTVTIGSFILVKAINLKFGQQEAPTYSVG